MPVVEEEAMQEHSTSRDFILIAAAVSALYLAVIEDAAAQAPKPEVHVSVFADRYVMAGRLIDDLDILEAAVAAMNAQAVRLDACGPGTDRAQMAAAHRFRHLELRLRGPDSPECASAIVPRMEVVSLRLRQRPLGIDDETVDRWRHDSMP
jgi:hypothetical protein